MRPEADASPRLVIGTAGWSLPKASTDRFPREGSHLERYAGRFVGVEINSSFYRPHRPATYERWAACVPAHFRFAAKVPKTITHERRLADAAAMLDGFLGEAMALGEKLGPLLVQLPPSLALDAAIAERFFGDLRGRFAGEVACEPRHATWFSEEATALLGRHAIARVAADPPLHPGGGEPGGWPGLVYRRLHGSPRVYYSAYEPAFLKRLAATLACEADRAPSWCIFDNTAHGHATADALETIALTAREPRPG